MTLLSRDDVTPETLASKSAETDVAVVQGHVANDFFAHGKTIPTVIDLYDTEVQPNVPPNDLQIRSTLGFKF